MTDELTSPGGSVTPTPLTPATGTPAPVGAMPQPATLSLEEAMKRIAELEHTHGNAKEELERHRKKVSSYEKAEAERAEQQKQAELAQLSEIERIKKQHAEIQAQHEAVIRELQETKIQHAVMREATGLNFIHPEIAARLLDWSELEYDSNGAPQNTQKLLDKLVKSMPELVRAPQAPAAQTESTNQPTAPTRPNGGLRPAPYAPAVPAMNPGRSNIPAPGTNPPGSPVRLSDVFSRKR